MENLGQYIRNKREQEKLTIEELSKKTLISPAVLRDIEAGKFDKYEGEEAYVKMYLKKISQVLNLDTEDVTQQYVELTREIELEKIREAEEVENTHNEEMVEKGKNFTFKVPQLTRKPSVYEDKSHVTLIRAAIILIVVCLIIVVLWYGFSQTRDKTEEPSFKPSQQSTVEGNVNSNDNQPQQNEPQTQDNQTGSSTDTGVIFTRDDRLDFSFKLPEGTEKFTFKVEFYEKSWAQMKVNGKNYKEFNATIYHDTDSEEPETKELEFNVADFQELTLKNGYSMGQRYYINNQEVPLVDDDRSSGITNFNLRLVKE